MKQSQHTLLHLSEWKLRGALHFVAVLRDALDTQMRCSRPGYDKQLKLTCSCLPRASQQSSQLGKAPLGEK